MNANVAAHLKQMAIAHPNLCALKVPNKKRCKSLSFRELDQLSDQYAHGLVQHGLKEGDRVLLMLKPGVDLIAVAFSLFKTKSIPIIIDPGMGLKNFMKCVKRSQPKVFIGIPSAHILSIPFKKTFASIKLKVTSKAKLSWKGPHLQQFRKHPVQNFPEPESKPDDPAAILFTSGSTGPPKGVSYEHGQFQAQLEILKNQFSIEAGEIDFPMLPIFALFNPALGMTTVIPPMNPSRPAKADPMKLITNIQKYKVTNSFGSPVLWKNILDTCQRQNMSLPSLKRVLIAGAPVPPELIRRFKKICPHIKIYTPYGATESLPITYIESNEIIQNTSLLTEKGKGMCVGKVCPGIQVKIIHPTSNDHPLTWNDLKFTKTNQIGEIIVSGPVVTKSYDQLPTETSCSKIKENKNFWHRMGDLGYIDQQQRLWFCGRKAHAVQTRKTTLYSVCCESIFNQHNLVPRSALIGLQDGAYQIPAIVIEKPLKAYNKKKFALELYRLAQANSITKDIRTFYVHPKFPVDVRHNAKIHRLELSAWARQQKPLPLPL